MSPALPSEVYIKNIKLSTMPLSKEVKNGTFKHQLAEYLLLVPNPRFPELETAAIAIIWYFLSPQ